MDEELRWQAARLQVGLDLVKMAFGCYILLWVVILVIAGIVLAWYFPNWTPLDALK